MCKYDVIHKTESTQRIATPPEEERSRHDHREQAQKLVKIGRVVPEICSRTDRDATIVKLFWPLISLLVHAVIDWHLQQVTASNSDVYGKLDFWQEKLKRPKFEFQVRFWETTLCLRKKQDTKLLPITSPNVNRFSQFFYWLTGKFATNSYLNIPPHLKGVATLPWEISMIKKSQCSRSNWSKLPCKTSPTQKTVLKYLSGKIFLG